MDMFGSRSDCVLLCKLFIDALVSCMVKKRKFSSVYMGHGAYIYIGYDDNQLFHVVHIQ